MKQSYFKDSVINNESFGKEENVIYLEMFSSNTALYDAVCIVKPDESNSDEEYNIYFLQHTLGKKHYTVDNAEEIISKIVNEFNNRMLESKKENDEIEAEKENE
jgi:hypothetical protein